MELKDYQKLAGNTDIVKYEVVIDQTESEPKIYKSKCLVLADTKAMIALVTEDDPEVVICVGVGNRPENVCLADKLGYPHVWRSDIDDHFRCEMYATFDEETAIDMMKHTILLEIEREITGYDISRDLVNKL